MTLKIPHRRGRGISKCALTALLLFLVIVLAPFEVSASDREDSNAPLKSERLLTLDTLIEKAAKDNPRVRAARLKWEAVRERYAQATALDDPMLTYTQPIEEIETRLGPQERMVSLSQKLPFPGKLSVKGRIATKEADIARATYEKILRDIVTEIKKTFYELRYIEEAISIIEDNKTVLEYFKKTSKTNYNLDLSGLDELVRAQRLSAAASYELIRLQDFRDATTAKLNILLNRNPSHPLPPLEEVAYRPFTYSLDELFELAFKNSDSLKIAVLKIEKSQLKKKLTSYDYLPKLRLGLNYSAIGEPIMNTPRGGDDAVAVSFGLNIPIWRGKYRAAGNEALKERDKAIIEKQGTLTKLNNTTLRLYSRLLNSEKILRLYKEELIPEAEGSIKFAEARYKNGEEKLSKILETRSMRLRFSLVYERALADYLISIAELERLTSKRLY